MPWEKIDTGQMLVTVRELAQQARSAGVWGAALWRCGCALPQVRSAQKGLRAWPLYAWIQDEAPPLRVESSSRSFLALVSRLFPAIFWSPRSNGKRVTEFA